MLDTFITIDISMTSWVCISNRYKKSEMFRSYSHVIFDPIDIVSGYVRIK